MINNRKISLVTLRWVVMALITNIVLFSSKLFAQTDTASVATTDTTINTATKNVFKELGKSVASKDTLSGLFMIVVIILIVILALYLSFRSTGSKVKRKKVIERQERRRAQNE